MKQQTLEKMLEILSANPTIDPPEIADLIGKSRQTVYGYLDELETSGKIHRNGNLEIIG